MLQLAQRDLHALRNMTNPDQFDDSVETAIAMSK